MMNDKSNMEILAIVLHGSAHCAGRSCDECKEFYQVDECPVDYRNHISVDFADDLYDRVFNPEKVRRLSSMTETEFLNIFTDN